MNKKRQPIYQQIALDIATRIARGDLKEGERISGRSILSSEYGVSPETIRRAMGLLEDESVVNVASNYGIIIGGKNAALNYLESFSSVDDIMQMRKELKRLMDERKQLDSAIEEMVGQIVDMKQRFSYSDPLKRLEFKLNDSSSLIGKSIASSQFYQTTKMTIVAIHRDGTMILSPGPTAVFERGDTIVVVGHVHDIANVEMLI